MTTEPTEFTFTSPSNCYAIARTDSCVRHPSVAWTVACSGCIQDALVQEYERGNKEAQRLDETKRPDVYQAGYKGPLPDSPEYLRGLADAKRYLKAHPFTIVEREALEASYKHYLRGDQASWSKYLETHARLRNERLGEP